MEKETLKSGKFVKNKWLILGVTSFLIVVVAGIVIGHSYASYRTTQSLNIASGNVSYTSADFNMVAIRLQSSSDKDTYNTSATIPTSGYYFNGTKSYCEVSGTKDTSVTMTYSGSAMTFGNVTKQGTKCYAYFDLNPTANITVASSTAGSNSWYKALTFQIAGGGGNTISSIKYCTTTSTSCTPSTTYTGSTTTVALSANASAQKVCATVTDSNGTTSSASCSSAYSVDGTPPTMNSITESEVTTSSIKVTVSATESHSGIATYYYKIGSNSYVSSTSNTYTFTGLSSSTAYTVYAYAVDRAGNGTTSNAISKSITTAAPGLSVSDIVAGATAGSTSITSTATTNEGIKYVSDGMYGGNTYYYRGAVNNNWVKFAGMYWRIIRFNGDGSIRMIYSGTTAPSSSTATVMTGTGTQTTTKAYNSSYNNAGYVGWYYSTSANHPTTSNGTMSTIADYLLNTTSGWYTSSGLSSYSSYIADGKFCNDRTTNTSYFSGYTNSNTYGTSNTAFAPATRVLTSSWNWNSTQTISTSCSNSSDIFTTKVGLITLDEVLMAGGKGGTGNSSYYLYTNQNYWTMSPRYYPDAYVFAVNSYGSLVSWGVVGTLGVRPVINLKAGTKFKTTTNGTYSAPYEVM